MVDTHTHYFHKRFDSGRDQIIRDLPNSNILAVIEGAIDFESNQKMKKLCEKYSHVYMTAGCHPNCVDEMDDEKYRRIIEVVDYHKVIAIGETGLDYARDKSKTQKSMQKEWFEKFIMLAVEKHKPLVIHCREAYDDMIKILRQYKLMECPGVIHCFSGNLEQAETLIDMGFYIGINGMFTNMNVDSEVCVALKTIPLERIVFETDSPYLVPVGVNGKRNTSGNLKYIAQRFAELRGELPLFIQKVAFENTKKLYPSIVVE